jgi:signal recognition particle subunit SRP54
MLEQSEEKLAKYKVIISSMTKAERTSESLLNNSGRVKRIAIGSGTSEKDVRSLVGDFVKMKKMLDRMQNDRGFRKRFSKLVPGM